MSNFAPRISTIRCVSTHKGGRTDFDVHMSHPVAHATTVKLWATDAAGSHGGCRITCDAGHGHRPVHDGRVQVPAGASRVKVCVERDQGAQGHEHVPLVLHTELGGRVNFCHGVPGLDQDQDHGRAPRDHGHGHEHEHERGHGHGGEPQPGGSTPPVVARVASVSAVQANEGDALCFTVCMTAAPSAATRVDLALSDGTAKAGDDYLRAGLQVSFDGGKNFVAVTGASVTVPAGATTFQVKVPTVEDGIVERSETMTLTASANCGSASGIGTICDDDVAPKVASVSAAQASEGDALCFTVGLSAATATATTVQLQLANGTAAGGQDYATTGLQASFDGGRTFTEIAGTSVTVPAGATSFQVKVPGLEDRIHEGDEVFTLQASTNGSTAQGIGTVIDDDAALKVLSVTGQDVVEGNSLVFRVDLAGSHTVRPGGSCCPPEQWACSVNGAKATVELGGYRIELDETGSRWLLTNKSTGACTRIWGDPHVDVGNDGKNDFDFKEDMTFQLADGTKITVETVPWGTGGMTLSSQLTITDWCNRNAMVVSGLGWDSDGKANLQVVKHDGEGRVLDLGTDDGAFTLYEGAQAGWTIFDGRPATQVLVNQLEAGTLSDPMTAVTLTLSDGTAVRAQDYQGKLEVSMDDGKTWHLVEASQVNVPARIDHFLVRVPTIDDAQVETRETLTLRASARDGFADGQGGILDNDCAPPKVVSVSPAQASEGDPLVFTVGLSAAATTATTVALQLANGTAAGGQDYATTGLEVSFDGGRTFVAITGTSVSVPAGATSFQVKVPSLEDTVHEGAEHFTLQASANGATAQGVGTICDDDAAPKVVSVGSAQASEGDPLCFTVGLSGTSTTATTVQLQLANGTATGGQDYATTGLEVSFDGGATFTAITGTSVTVPAGAGSFQVRVPGLEDTVFEGAEKFTLQASANGGTAQGVGTICDDDAAPKVVSVSSVHATEGDPLCFAVTLSGGSAGATAVQLQFADGTATLGQDYQASGLEVSFDGGSTYAPLSGSRVDVPAGVAGFLLKVPSVEDSLTEPTESFTLQASANGGFAQGTGTICDDDVGYDPGSVTIVGADKVIEGAAVVGFTVKLAEAAAEDTWVSVRVMNETAVRTAEIATGQEYYPDAHVKNSGMPGVSSLVKDFTVFDASGAAQEGDTVRVLVRAGATESDAFTVQAWQEMQRWNQQGNTREGDETFRLEVAQVGELPVAGTSAVQVTVCDNHISRISPIILDLDGNGVQTTSIAESAARFDMNLDGQADRTGWVSAGDAFLVHDDNRDGVVNDRSELFGGAEGEGFAKLAGFDSNRDGSVDARDERFGELQLWQDRDGDGQTDAGELVRLDEAGIAALRVAYEVQAQEQNGNLLLERSEFSFADGRQAEMADAYFAVQGDSDGAIPMPRLADVLVDTREDAIPLGPSAAAGGAGGAGLDPSAALGDGLVDLEHLMHRPAGGAAD